MSSWGENLPDVSKWQPRADATETLANLFAKRCAHIEKLILLRARAEKDGNLENFDSGLGIECILREELSRLLPSRYTVSSGVVDDRYGKTAGDCDVVIFDERWFPSIKASATESSRRAHFPIESVYGVLEVKSTLDVRSLDEAMAKLVKCHRLHRPTVPGNRIVENRWILGSPRGISNPLYSSILAINLGAQSKLEELINRFFAINRKLKRHEVVRSLCVLGHGTVTWGLGERSSPSAVAKFSDDYDVPIYPVYYVAETIGSALYPLANDLLANLTRTILAPEDIPTKYGINLPDVKIPNDPSVVLPPCAPPRVRDPEDPANPWGNRSP